LDLSVLLVSYKTRDLTVSCIESVIEDLGELQAEILVADNHSQDGTVETLRERFPECTVIGQTENHGFGRAQNRLALAARGRRLLILNPDTEIQRGCLARLDRWLDEHPETALVGPKTLYPDGRVQDTAFRFPSLTGEFLTTSSLGLLLRKVPLLGAHLGLSGSPGHSGPVDYLQGSCLLCRREAFEQVDGFDESYFLFSEEVDLQRRLSDLGWSCDFVAEAQITHHHGKSMEQDPVRNYVELYQGKIRYFEPRLSPVQRHAVRLMWKIFHGSRWIVLAPIAALSGSKHWKLKAQKHGAVLTLLSSKGAATPRPQEEN